MPDSNDFRQSAISAETGWMDDALCLGMDPELFFPMRGESTRHAKNVCKECPVRIECLNYANTSPYEKHGIWGGLSERERRRMYRPGLGRVAS